MYSSINSAIVQGLDVTIVKVEMDISNGLPGLQIVGSASSEVKESGERVRTAIKNMGIQLPPKKMVVNLTPANIRKVGTGLDLPIAVALLSAYGLIDGEQFKNTLVIGEIGLDGNIYGVKGVMAIVNKCKKEGIKTCLVPQVNQLEGTVVEGVNVCGISQLSDIKEGVNKEYKDAVLKDKIDNKRAFATKDRELDYKDIIGQEQMKRAVQIAVAGRHNMLMIGASGAGKSMVAKRIPSILPLVTFDESMEMSRIYSVMGLLNEEFPYVTERPFREVHHTITKAALIGGGNPVRPGELSLAHGGVLFLDELPEFSKSVLEVLRQPLEDKMIRITRSKGSYDFPADVLLIAAMNPCPCGHYPDMNKCTCTDYEINRYLSKISQPLLDRIDICVDVPRVEFEVLRSKNISLDSHTMQENVLRAIEKEKVRFQRDKISYNSEIPNKLMECYCALDPESEAIMKQAYQCMELSVRTYYKVIKVARTIADLGGSDKILPVHIKEALGYRMINKTYWRR